MLAHRDLPRSLRPTAATIDDPLLVVDCLQARIDALRGPQTAELRLAIANRMVAAAQRTREPMADVRSRLERLVALTEHGDPHAHGELDEIERVARQAAHPHLTWLVLTRRTMLTLLTGDLQEAESLLAAHRELGRRLDEPDRDNVAGTQRIGLALWRHGLAAAYQEALKGGGGDPGADGIREVVRLISRGDDLGAGSVLRTRVLPLLKRKPAWTGLAAESDIAELAAQVGAVDVCQWCYEKLRPFAGRFAVAGAAAHSAGPISLYLGICATALGRHLEAATWLRHAADQASLFGARLWHARALTELAAVTAHQSAQRAEIAALADAADRIAPPPGASWLLHRLEAVGPPKIAGTLVRLEGDGASPSTARPCTSHR